MPEKQDEELGALWVSSGAQGEYLTGTISGVRVVCFKNTRKPAGSKQPDYRVLRARPRDGDEGPRQVVDVFDGEAPREDEDPLPF